MAGIAHLGDGEGIVRVVHVAVIRQQRGPLNRERGIFAACDEIVRQPRGIVHWRQVDIDPAGRLGSVRIGYRVLKASRPEIVRFGDELDRTIRVQSHLSM
ncbi:hypothetical protein D3C81_1564550 [compost metagenome]